MLRQVCQPVGAIFIEKKGETVCICMDLILEAQNVQ